MRETDKLIEEQFKRLPEILQEALNTISWKSLFREIPLLNKLSPQQVSDLERETLLVIYGFQDLDYYVPNIMRELETDRETTVALAEAVNEKVFKQISLKIDELEKQKLPTHNNSVTKIQTENLPMIEPGEKVHNAPHIEERKPTPVLSQPKPIQPIPPASQPGPKPEPPKEKVALPDYRYQEGKDPYREPLK